MVPSLTTAVRAGSIATAARTRLPGEFEAMERRQLLSGLALTGLLGVAACQAAPPASPSASPSHRRVHTSKGPVQVPQHPQRIIAVNSYPMVDLFDLGIDPIGVYDAGEQYVEQRFLQRYRKIAKVSDGQVAASVDLEKVAALQPDLILGIDAIDQQYEKLTAIAPTVLLTFGDSGDQWKKMAAQTADVVNSGAKLAGLEKIYRARCTDIKTRYADVLAKIRWDLVQGGFTQGAFWAYGDWSPVGNVITTAGGQLAKLSTTIAASKNSVSYEEIDRLSDADAILYYTENDGTPANYGRQLFAQPVFRQLRAVNDKHLWGSTDFLVACYSDATKVLDVFEKAIQTFR